MHNIRPLNQWTFSIKLPYWLAALQLTIASDRVLVTLHVSPRISHNRDWSWSIMTTVEEVMCPHFRLKVDLSKFFHDARRFCWIFIDGIKIQQIIHMKQHISKLFNIMEPFHFLLNDTEYLPPIEDVRILKENETILLVLYSILNYKFY